MPFSLETGRTDGGTFFHILRHNRRVATVWSADHSDTLASEVFRVLKEHASLDVIDRALGWAESEKDTT